MNNNLKYKLTRYLKAILLNVIMFSVFSFLVSCGDSTDDDKPGETAKSTDILYGQFIDAEVDGLTYSSSSGLTGTTDTAGTYRYYGGDRVSFSIGKFEIGSAKGNNRITPKDIAAEIAPDDKVGEGKSASDTALKIVSFLLLLDNDGDPSNGIQIDKSISDAFSAVADEDVPTPEEAFKGEDYKAIDGVVEKAIEKIDDGTNKDQLLQKLNALKAENNRLETANQHFQDTLNNLITEAKVTNASDNTEYTDGSNINLSIGETVTLNLSCKNESDKDISCLSKTDGTARFVKIINNKSLTAITTNNQTEDTVTITGISSGVDKVFIQFGGFTLYLELNITAGDNTDSDNSGSDNTGSDNTGSDNTGSDNTGSDNTGSDNTGSDDTVPADATAGEDPNDSTTAAYIFTSDSSKDLSFYEYSDFFYSDGGSGSTKNYLYDDSNFNSYVIQLSLGSGWDASNPSAVLAMIFFNNEGFASGYTHLNFKIKGTESVKVKFADSIENDVNDVELTFNLEADNPDNHYASDIADKEGWKSVSIPLSKFAGIETNIQFAIFANSELFITDIYFSGVSTGS